MSVSSPPIQRTPAGVTVQPETMVLLAQLIRDQLELNEQQVVIYNQDWKLPKDPGIHIVVNFLGSKPFGGTGPATLTDPEGNFVEDQSYSLQETYSVHIFSADASARQRKEELLFALNSTQAEQIAEKYALRIPQLSLGFVDASYAEGSAIINRYVLTIAVQRGYARRRTIDYFSNFPGSPAVVSQP